MNALESVRVAARGVLASPLRSALTMLGISIGVGAVIVLLAVGQRLVGGRARRDPAAGYERAPRERGGWKRRHRNAERVHRPDAGGRGGARQSAGRAQRPPCLTRAQHGRHPRPQGFVHEPQVIGSDAEYFVSQNHSLAGGRLFTDQETTSGSRVLVSGRLRRRTSLAMSAPWGPDQRERCAFRGDRRARAKGWSRRG